MTLKTVFLGNPSFSLPVLEELYQNDSIDLIAVYGSPDKPSGRGKKITSPPTITYAKKNNIKVFQQDSINKDDEFISFCDREKPDLFIVLAFSHFLSEKILSIPKSGCFNIHTSLLPKYRGSSPIHYALLNGDKTTGVSIQKMVKKMDAGDIAHSIECLIESDEDYLTLSDKLSTLSKKAISEFIHLFKNNTIKYVKQNETNVTFAPLIKKVDGHITFRESANEILNKIKAYKAWPGTYFSVDEKSYKFFDVEISEDINLPPGKIKITKTNLYIGTSDKTLSILSMQPPGKPLMKTASFINGYKFQSQEVSS